LNTSRKLAILWLRKFFERKKRIAHLFFCVPGMNKMVINSIEKLFVTADAATILKELEVVHPAAKLAVMAAQRQEEEVRFRT
jgi:hypothetical protein